MSDERASLGGRSPADILADADAWLARKPAGPGRLPKLVADLRTLAGDLLIDRDGLLARPLRCWDCGLAYSDPAWCDVVVPDDAWLKISPTGHEGGVLCFTCIARRLGAAGLKDVPVIVTSGPFRAQEWPQ